MHIYVAVETVGNVYEMLKFFEYELEAKYPVSVSKVRFYKIEAENKDALQKAIDELQAKCKQNHWRFLLLYDDYFPSFDIFKSLPPVSLNLARALLKDVHIYCIRAPSELKRKILDELYEKGARVLFFKDDLKTKNLSGVEVEAI